MLYYLVASTTCCMVGIEQCRVFSVRRSLRAAFEKEYAGRILLVGSSALSWPVQFCVYNRASALFILYSPWLIIIETRQPFNCERVYCTHSRPVIQKKIDIPNKFILK